MRRVLLAMLIPLAAVALAIPGLPAEEGAKLLPTWRILTSATLFFLGMIAVGYLGIRHRRVFLQRCPQCRAELLPTPAMIVMASGRCGICGFPIIHDDA